MEYIADLHIHSRFSRATSRSLNLPALDLWAAKKGIAVVGTGDVTHPEWFAEIRDQLLEAEEGLFRLRPDMAHEGGGAARFVLSGEISSIYKKDGRVRKVHSLLLFPDLNSAEGLSRKLAQIGNIASDGRPILGLDAKILLALCLEVSEDIFFIPAHIWTPWFSLLGSKSGFDAVEECFEDLSGHIHALETGLSSDPAMNWRLSILDRFVLVSNSDAHSAEKLGREANLFDTDLSYPGMIRAMRDKQGFSGTLEFFPEEGKYHLDGHRKCGVRLVPEETRSNGGLCPVCGKPVTVGVYNRVLDLADRPAGVRPDSAAGYESLIPLSEVLGEVMGVGPKSKRVTESYEDLLRRLGPELFILRQAELSDLKACAGEIVGLAIERMRQGRVHAEGGYDGEYGAIHVFAPGELERIAGQNELFSYRPRKKKTEAASGSAGRKKRKADKAAAAPRLLVMGDPLLDDLNPEQKGCVTRDGAPLAIVAGPGTGKTLVLTRRAAWLVREGLIDPERILGLTFTRQASREMSQRLAAILPFRSGAASAAIVTFHALGLMILKEHLGAEPAVLSEEGRLEVAKKAARGKAFKAAELVNRISLAKHRFQGPEDLDDPDTARAFQQYEAALAERNALDYDDLLARPVGLLSADPGLADTWRQRYPCLLVDEYQDINQAQYRLIKLLAGGPRPNLTVIGDPDQAIYGFRGADAGYFQRFNTDYPEAETIHLTRNYRSAESILRASGQVISNNPGLDRPELASGIKGPARLTTAGLATPAAEAEYVVMHIEKLLGGTSHFALDSGRADFDPGEFSLSDVAILYRLHALAGPMAEALDRAGLPFQRAGEEPARETDHMDFAAEKISLLTMHAAKGLEFNIVFVIGLEEGILPYQPPNKPPSDVEEERRLFFVALTRAKQHLFLTHANRRSIFGKKGSGKSSPFLQEIHSSLKKADALPERKPKPENRQMALF